MRSYSGLSRGESGDGSEGEEWSGHRQRCAEQRQKVCQTVESTCREGRRGTLLLVCGVSTVEMTNNAKCQRHETSSPFVSIVMIEQSHVGFIKCDCFTCSPLSLAWCRLGAQLQPRQISTSVIQMSNNRIALSTYSTVSIVHTNNAIASREHWTTSHTVIVIDLILCGTDLFSSASSCHQRRVTSLHSKVYRSHPQDSSLPSPSASLSNYGKSRTPASLLPISKRCRLRVDPQLLAAGRM